MEDGEDTGVLRAVHRAGHLSGRRGTVAQNPAASVVDGLSWEEFERLVGEGFRLQGYGVI